MRHLSRFVLFAAVSLLPLAASAQPYKKHVNAAAEALEEAEKKARRAQGACRSAVAEQLDDATDRTYDLRKRSRAREVQKLKLELSSISSTAMLSGCPMTVLENIQRAIESLEEARIQMWGQRRGDDDDDDDRDQDQGPMAYFAQLSALKVTTNAVFEGENAVKVSVPELRLTNMRGQTFYLGARFRSYEGRWSDWVTTQQWTVPSDPFAWRNAFNHFFRYSTLAEEDHSDGRFVARVSVFDGRGQELAFREVVFRVGLPQLPPAPPVMPPPPPVQPPVVVGPPRDCGTGTDIGCSMQRDGQFAMDAATFQGFMQSMRTNSSEMGRSQICATMFQRSYVTAIQFGMVLDLFTSEMTRFNVAQMAARRVVNPQHALGYASKWSSSMYATQYTQLMAQQGGPGLQQPPPMQPPMQPPVIVRPPAPVVVQPGPPLPPPGTPGYQQPARDCGTGADPGCTMSRNGNWAMDGAAFQGFVASLRANYNELGKRDICQSVLATNYLTAQQLSTVLDLFQNELTKLDVAKLAAPRLVNPQHALGFGAKFQNRLLGQECVQVMASQR